MVQDQVHVDFSEKKCNWSEDKETDFSAKTFGSGLQYWGLDGMAGCDNSNTF